MRKHVDHLISQLATSPQEDSEIIAGNAAKSSKKQDNNPNLLPKNQQNIFKKPEKQKNSCSSSDSDEDLFPNPTKNCVVSETERKNYVRVHHMFSQILNFLFIIVFSRKSCLFYKKDNSYVIMAFYNLLEIMPFGLEF